MEEYRYHLFATCEREAESKDMAQILCKHFSVKGKSGGGDCKVFEISSGLFCISFKSEQVRDRVMNQSQKIMMANSEVVITLHESPVQAKTVLERKEESKQLLINLEEISIAACEVCTAQIQIPFESVYTDLLEPHYLKSIQEDFTDVNFQFDIRTLMLQITGTPQSVSSAKRDVNDALRRLKSKEINMAPALTTYLKSRGSGLVSKIYFLPEEIAASIDVRLNSSVVIHGLSHYDIKRAENILIEDLATKVVKIHEEEDVSVVNTNSFEDFVEALNKTYTGVQVSVVDSNENKPVCMVAGRKTDLSSVEEKIHEFIHKQSKTTVNVVLDGTMELIERIPLLLDKLELSHLSGRVKWNQYLETLELTGTQKENDENMESIKEKTKGLQCKTVIICQPGAYSYFKANGQEFLNLLHSMLSCMAVLETEPGKVNLQAGIERNPASKGKGSDVLLHEEDKDMCLTADNIIVKATISDKLTELSDVIINPLCRFTTDSKILSAAGPRVKTELARTVQRNAITLTGPGDLPCRLLVHIPCLCGPKAKEYLQDAIQECQKRKYKSITVLLDENELHQIVDEQKLGDFIQMTLQKMNAGEMMSVVFAQQRFFQSFKRAAESVYKEKHTGNMESKDDPESLHRHSVLCEPAVIHVFSKQSRLRDKAKAAIEKHYAAFLSTDMLINPHLRTCGDKALAKICQLQEKHSVNVIIGDGTLTFNGLAVKTSIAREEAAELIKEDVNLKQLEHKREVLQNIQWVINDEEVGPVKLRCEDNYDVEVQYMCLHEPIEVTYDDKTFTVNVSDMNAINKETSQVHPVLRTELIVESFPGKWSVSEEKKFKKVELEIDSLEYISVERQFNETLSSKIINKIERIENRNLWKRFSLDLTGEVKLLFYGLKHADVGKVEKNGFFRPPETFFSYETAQGRGIYFYVNASCAQRRCEADAQGQKVMFLGRVETGIFTVGRKGINMPPPVDPSDPGVLYHSVVDYKNNPSVFVVFSSDRTYPEYCIMFSDGF
ncbi:protein mono-ADP-ribosyltransferase PARP14-like [Colossoma macropomum]|uniref:protein mono-ADP-ribosyltransferase PARP14-like n=1 Tax=Colossoma macropomum TaxID=42526 RepID=UPI001863BC4E|nr:protein mono-ADP-ribosyltransferase PARP14-like [Colossoma macropomum]